MSELERLDKLIGRIPDDGDPFKDLLHLTLDILVRGVLSVRGPCIGQPHGGRPCSPCASELVVAQAEKVVDAANRIRVQADVDALRIALANTSQHARQGDEFGAHCWCDVENIPPITTEEQHEPHCQAARDALRETQ